MGKSKIKIIKSILFWSLLVVMTLIGSILLFLEPIKTQLVGSYHPDMTVKTVDVNQRKDANYDFSQVKAVTAGQVLSARLSAQNLHPIGQILMPDVGLHLPIGLGVSNQTLMLMAGTMKADQTMGTGNYALAGHHMLDHHVLFSPLYDRAQVGMDVYLTDLRHVYTYRLFKRQIIAPTDVNVIDNTKKPTLTLITCNDSGSKRLLLQGHLVKTTPLKQAPAAVLKLMVKTTNNHNVLKGY